MEIDASDASAAPPTAPQRAKKGGRATNTYNWQTGETIMAVFAALSASEAVSSSEIPQRWQKAGVFYRQYVVELPTWGLWWVRADLELKFRKTASHVLFACKIGLRSAMYMEV
jgi:hypothetical protein